MNLKECIYVRSDGIVNFAVAAIGNAGKAAVDAIRFKAEYASDYFCLEPMTDKKCLRRNTKKQNFQELHYDYFFMMILADLEEPGAVDAVRDCIESFSEDERELFEETVLVTTDRFWDTQVLDRAGETCDKIFLVENEELLHLPLLIFRNLESGGIVGVDFDDVYRVFRDGKVIHVMQAVYGNIQQAIGDNSKFLERQAMKQRRFGCSYGNAFVAASFDQQSYLDDVEAVILERLADRMGDNVLFHCVFNEDKDDPRETVIFFDCVKEHKHI